MCYHANISRIHCFLSLFFFFEFLFFFLIHCFKGGIELSKNFYLLIFTCRNSGDTKVNRSSYLGWGKDKLGEWGEGVTF